MTNIASPAPPPPPPPPPPAPPPPGDPRGAAPDPPPHDATPTPRSRLRRLQWVKIPAGRVAGAGRSVWSDVGDRFGSTSSGPPRLDFAEMEELFRVAEPAATTVNGVVRRPSDDVTSGDRTKHRDEVRHSTAASSIRYSYISCRDNPASSKMLKNLILFSAILRCGSQKSNFVATLLLLLPDCQCPVILLSLLNSALQQRSYFPDLLSVCSCIAIFF